MRITPKHITLIIVLFSVMSLSVNAQYVSQITDQFQSSPQRDTLAKSSTLRLYPKLSFYLPTEDIHLGAACKIENRQYYFDKKRFNYRVRLGNLDYVNYLEGKTTHY